MRKIIPLVFCTLPFAAQADIPVTKDTRCIGVTAAGRAGKSVPCRAQAVSSAPRPNLPDTRSLSYQKGGRNYGFTADYDSETQQWRPQYRGKPLTVYYRSRGFKRLETESAAARYTCFQSDKLHFCTPKAPAPFW